MCVAVKTKSKARHSSSLICYQEEYAIKRYEPIPTTKLASWWR